MFFQFFPKFVLGVFVQLLVCGLFFRCPHGDQVTRLVILAYGT